MDNSKEIPNFTNQLFQVRETLTTITEKDESAAEENLEHSKEFPKLMDPHSIMRRELNFSLIPRVPLTIRHKIKNKRLQSCLSRVMTCLQNKDRSLILQQMRKMTDESMPLRGINVPSCLHLNIHDILVRQALCCAQIGRVLPGPSQSNTLPWLTDSGPWPSLHAARQTFDGLPPIRRRKFVEEIDPVESIEQEELLMNMAAMNIRERKPPPTV
ncbi:uncharacterized protein LOC123265610 [Cotesia glomerata]|uniref:Uncharacterized protein n=1 Tax=Cotesia glomerata TaxID=32391 RepID=A0AAV7IY98_COTGL|nr:uncharacterized protein LOC123265610 [Cotesia glomerata]KAH0560784.1 hypothetical protein KQX54_008307 [Cotesia glomerata]